MNYGESSWLWNYARNLVRQMNAQFAAFQYEEPKRFEHAFTVYKLPNN